MTIDLAATVSIEAITELYRGVALKLGASDEEADIYSRCFARADLRHDTQGLSLWLEWALPLAEAGGGRFGMPLRILKETPSSIVVDGSGAIGQVVTTMAMERVIALAKQTGVAIGLISGTTDTSMAANYALQALDHGCIGIATCTAGPASVAPWGGRTAAFGTNPFALVAPAGPDQPIVIDMCCATYSIGTLVNAARAGWIAPSAVVVDSEGRYSANPADIVSDLTVREPALTGAILPEGVKGSALLLMVELLAGVLTGNGVSLDQTDWSTANPPHVGAFLCVIDIAQFMPVADFAARAAAFAQVLRMMPPAAGFGAVRVPGDHASLLEAERRANGIAVSAKHWNMIGDLCARHDLPLPAATMPQ
jgi:LDH2 family malate/lactate/ureidoglycolate dehydrogenase